MLSWQTLTHHITIPLGGHDSVMRKAVDAEQRTGLA